MMLEVKSVSDRLMMTKLQKDKRTAVVVSAYAPEKGLTNNEKDRFYERIIKVIAYINKKDMVVIGGDLRGYVGKQVDGYDSVHLKHRG